MLNFCPKKHLNLSGNEISTLNWIRPVVSLVACHACTRSPTLKSVFVYSHASRERKLTWRISLNSVTPSPNAIADCLKLQSIAVFDKVDFFASPFDKITDSGHCTFPLSFHIFQSISVNSPVVMYTRWMINYDTCWQLKMLTLSRVRVEDFFCLWILNVGLFINDGWFVRLTISSPHRVTLHSLWRHSILGILHRHIPF